LVETAPRPIVLVVDDEPRNRALLRAALAADYDSVERENGEGALAYVDANPVDIVLLDVMMPGMDGHAVCRAIKARPREGFLPVILLTALADQESRNAGLAAGADEFLSKPFDTRELLLRVRALVALREQERVIRRQRDELEELQTLKDDLFSLVIHDMRNPLSGVVGFVELLRHSLHDDPRLGSFADQALESATKLRGLLEEVLDIRRLEERTMPMKREKTPTGALVTDAVATVEGAARARNVSIEVERQNGGSVTVDRGLIRRAIENLLANAIRFSPPGEAIQLRAHPAGEQWELEVADRGPGIPDKTKLVLFRKFATGENRTTQRRGFGLGLYLVKLVAQVHGGDVSVFDRPSGGTIFRLTVPTLGTS
jgi:two-component system sensor histidine kinase/response regulator